MNITTWIAIYLPMFIIFFIILPQGYVMQMRTAVKRKKKVGIIRMTNEILKSYVGKICKISGGSYGVNVKGRIVDVNENWIVVQTSRGDKIVNAEFVQSIRIDS